MADESNTEFAHRKYAIWRGSKCSALGRHFARRSGAIIPARFIARSCSRCHNGHSHQGLIRAGVSRRCEERARDGAFVLDFAGWNSGR